MSARGWVAAALLGLIVTGAIVFADARASAAETEGWSAIAEQKVFYTDNAFQLSSARRLALAEDPSQPAGLSISQPSDFVWEPSIDVRRTSSNRFGRLEISAKAHGFIFTEHPELNHGNYRIQAAQALSPKTSLLLRYRYVPNLLLGPNIERQTGTLSIQEERVTSHIWRAQLEHALTELVNVDLLTRAGLRYYNQIFSERDTVFYTLGPRVKYAVRPGVTLSLGYQYERGLADGRGDATYNDDISYRQHFVETSADFFLTPKLSLGLMYVFRRKDFTSDLVGDPHNGRRDTTNQGTAELRYAAGDAIDLALGYQYTRRSSNVVIKDFHDTNVSAGIQYRF